MEKREKIQSFSIDLTIFLCIQIHQQHDFDRHYSYYVT